MKVIRSIGKNILGVFGRICPKANAKFLFLMRTHKWPNLKNPQTFNEKTTWLKLNNYNDNSLVSKCADKYAVREYVKEKGCGKILNEFYGLYDNFDDIDFDKLPNQFVLKCTHGCAYNIIVKDKSKMDKIATRKKINRWMKEKYGYATSELHYTKIKPRIIAEKYLCDKDGKMPVDYKFYCMNGKVECVLVCSERDEELKLSYYDAKWKRLSYEKESWSSKKHIEKPKNLNKMVKCAEKLSEGFPFVRVDFYSNNKKIVFGELTFTPACGCAPYYTEDSNMKLGESTTLYEKKCKSICIIGHFGGDKNFTDGQTVKTKELYNFLLKKSQYRVLKIDTYKIKWHFLKKIIEIRKTIKNVDAIVLIVSSRGYKILTPVIYFFNKKRNKELYDFVVGGNRQNIFAHNDFLSKCAKKYRKIYVETNKILENYKQNGFDNVEVMNNCKNIKSFTPKKYNKSKKVIKLCTFSRVCREKGILDAINVVKKANELDENHEYKLDIYGDVENSFRMDFEKAIKKYSKFVSYEGPVSPYESTKILSRYDVLLFLTFWPGEGFPGTLIDCFFAAIPVVATDWNYNFDILKDGKTGIKVTVGEVDEAAEKLVYLINHSNILEKISLNCYNERLRYIPQVVYKPFVEALGGGDETKR